MSCSWSLSQPSGLMEPSGSGVKVKGSTGTVSSDLGGCRPTHAARLNCSARGLARPTTPGAQGSMSASWEASCGDETESTVQNQTLPARTDWSLYVPTLASHRHSRFWEEHRHICLLHRSPLPPARSPRIHRANYPGHCARDGSARHGAIRRGCRHSGHVDRHRCELKGQEEAPPDWGNRVTVGLGEDGMQRQRMAS